jgi:tetratricopeptide (TPR) repeat protein
VAGEADIAKRWAAIAQAAAGNGDLDAALVDVHRLPADLPGRGALAAGLVDAIMRADPHEEPRRFRHLDGLLRIADSDPPPRADWPGVRATARATALLRVAAEDEISDARSALAELEDLASDSGDHPAMPFMQDAARMVLTYRQAIEDGDEFALRQVPDGVRKLRDLAASHPVAEPMADLIVKAAEVMAAHQRGENPRAALEELRVSAARLPSGHYLRTVVDDVATTMDPFLSDGDGAEAGRVPPTDEQLAAVSGLTRRSDLGAADRALYHSAAGGAGLGDWEETDPARINASIDHFRAALDLAPNDPRRVFHLQGLALGLFRRSELTNSVDDIEEAAGLLEDALKLAGPGHPLWSGLNQMLSHARRRGDTPAPHKIAVDGLRNYAWKVMLQSDLAAANVAVRRAAGEAVDIARQCLLGNDPADAIRALDAGRGLALFAATEVRNVGSRLDDAGRPELARRWREASASAKPDDLPTDLRREVLTVLSAESRIAALLDAPGLGEIRDGLTTLDADALIYLVPGERPTPGYAVIAPVEGRPSYLALPNLQLEKDLDVERYLTALARRDAAIADPRRDLSPLEETQSDFLHSLDTLCDWAWRAAIGPLVERYLPRLGRSASGRPPRVVLIPMGELARIPWQAARRSDGRYAIQLVAFSQAASARMLCHSAGLPAVRLSPVGLVVGDPDTAAEAPDLAAARIEAYAIHRSFYRGARYVGRRVDGSQHPSGAGTVEEVRDWLTTNNPAAGAMLHLACHGVLKGDPSAATSYLLLARGGRLTAEELVDLMARSPERAIGLIVLAACRTGQAISGYDEAYSLGTAFLAGGARSVLSTQWSIPDRATSVLMFMFHHYLMTEGLPAWAALREAQLWMLDPGRSVPDRMPSQLRGQLVEADLAGVVAWAGFVHWGQ